MRRCGSSASTTHRNARYSLAVVSKTTTMWPVLNFLSHASERQILSILRCEMPAEGMSPSVGQRLWPSLVVIFILWLAIFVPGLPQPSLFDDADGAHAEAGREMLTLHDWVTLHENGIRYLEKAPLPYWAMAISFKLFGITEWTARLPQALGVLALAFVLLRMGGAFLSADAGFWAAVVSVTSFGPYLFTRILIPDLMVGLWLALGLYFFLLGWQEQQPSRLACWGLAATVALNVLTKSLIGLVFPCAI